MSDRAVMVRRPPGAAGAPRLSTVDGPFWPGAGQPVRPAGTLPRRADAASSARPAARSALASGVSSRERAVLALLADGCSTRETAQRLCYSERTIKNVVQEITSRLHLRNRTQAVAYAVRRGWI